MKNRRQMRWLTAGALLGVWLAAGTVNAQTAVCDGLSGPQKALAKKIMDAQYLYDCCDQTISGCLAAKNRCALATRIADMICYRVSKGEDEEKIVLRLTRRAQSMNVHGKKATIDYGEAAVTGEASAPVRVMVYACASCVFCGRMIPDLYREVVSGTLKGKVRLYYKTFPLRNHENTTEAGLAVTAAKRMDAFWPYMLKMYGNFRQFTPERAAQWAAAEGMDAAEFTRLMNDRATRNSLVASRKEGIVNQVTSTPTLFVNGRRYRGFLDLEEVVDILEEEYERLK